MHWNLRRTRMGEEGTILLTFKGRGPRYPIDPT